MNRVFITGFGVISALGKNKNENLAQLQAGKSGIKTSQYLQSIYTQDYLFGEVKYSCEILQKKLGLQISGLTRTDLLAFTAFNEAIEHAEISSAELESIETAFISASTMGGMCMAEQLYAHGNKNLENTEYLQSYSTNTHALNIAEKYNLTGIVSTVNTACSSSTNAIMLATKLIQCGKIKRAIVGGVDSLGKFSVNGFQALRILSQSACSPFDQDRSGMTLGEGAGYLILESESSAHTKKTYAEILGYGNTNDMFHPTSLSEDGEGVANCMKLALSNACVKAEEIDYINTHGTATYNNDLTELAGMNKVFSTIPPFNSTKSYTGHTLAAAGAIEVIYSVFSLFYNELYSSLNFLNPIKKFNQSPIANYKKTSVNKVLSNSFAFGGNCSSIIISKS